jgi:hypothetical protein
VGAPAKVGEKEREREMEERKLKTGIVITSGFIGTSAVSRMG